MILNWNLCISGKRQSTSYRKKCELFNFFHHDIFTYFHVCYDYFRLGQSKARGRGWPARLKKGPRRVKAPIEKVKQVCDVVNSTRTKNYYHKSYCFWTNFFVFCWATVLLLCLTIIETIFTQTWLVFKLFLLEQEW